MANEIKNYRSAIAQDKRNNPMYTFLVWELIIWGTAMFILCGWMTNSSDFGVVAAIVTITGLVIGLAVPALRFIAWVILGIGWAVPFIFLGSYCEGGGIFYLLGVVAFFVSFTIHYWATTYAQDLARQDK